MIIIGLFKYSESQTQYGQWTEGINFYENSRNKQKSKVKLRFRRRKEMSWQPRI